MSGEIGQEEVVPPKRRSHVKINLAHEFLHFLDDEIPDSVRLDIFHGGNEARYTERVGPGIFDLPQEEILLAVRGELVEGRSRLGTQDDRTIVHRILWQAYRDEPGPQGDQHREGRVVVCLILLHAVEVAFQITDT